MKLVLLACLICVAVAGDVWGKEGKVEGPVSAVKGGTGDAKDGWKATGRFGHIVIKGDGTYNYVIDVKSDLVKYFATRPNVLVDRFHISTPSGDKEIAFDVATIPKPGDEKKADAKKADAKKDDAKKDDAKKADTKKDDAKKADTKKDDAKKADTKKDDAKKADTKKADTKKADAKKDDKKKDDGKKGKKGPIPGSVPLIAGHYYKGDQGAGVRAVQKNLKALGYDLTIDGIYGPQTTDRVSKFQKSVGLQGLGMVGPKTMAKLIEKTGQKMADANNHGGVQLPPPSPGKGGKGGSSGAPAGAPKWMNIALKENAKRIVEFKTGSNKEIEKYHVAAGLPGHSDATPWCASFITWVMKTAGYTPARTGARALSWSDAWPEGKKLPGPVYGAIAVKTRDGGGHVGFVLGTIGSTYLAILGGNQGDTLSVAKYAKSVFHAYMVPKSYNAPPSSSLKPYKGSFGVAGKEA